MKNFILSVFTIYLVYTGGACGQESSKVNPVPQLLKNLDSLDEHTSANAAHSLGVVYKSKDTNRDQLQSAVEKLIEKMNTSKWTRVRLECMGALADIRASKAVEPLREMVKHENTALATGAGNALAKILHVDEARKQFKELATDPSESVQRVAYAVMVDLATQEDVEFLVAGIDSKNWRIQVDALRGLERAVAHGARLSSDVYAKVASVLGNDIANVTEAAIRTLIRVRSVESLNTLITAADTKGNGSASDSSWRVRANALKGLNNMGFPANASGIPAFIRNLDDPTANVQREAKAGLNRVRTASSYFRATPETVGPIADRYLYPRFLGELEKAESPGLRTRIIDEMGSTRVPSNYADRVAVAAAKCLEDSLGNEAALKLRNQSLDLLGGSGATGIESALRTSLATLKGVLENKNEGTWSARARALKAVNTIGFPRNESILPDVVRQLDDRTANVLNEARDVLNRTRRNSRGKSVVLETLVKELTSVEEAKLKAKILREMGHEIPTQHASTVATIASEALADSMGNASMWEMRAGAVTVLGGTATTGDIELIAQCVGDDEPTVRQAAGEALARLSEVCEPAETAKVISTLLPLIEKSVDWRKASIAARALGKYPTADAVKALVRMTGHSVVNVKENASLALIDFVNDPDAKLSSNVETEISSAMKEDKAKWEYGANVLGALKSDSALPVLLPILSAEDDWRAQVNAIEAILAINAETAIKDKQVSDAIIKCTLSKVRQVHETANRALRTLTPAE